MKIESLIRRKAGTIVTLDEHRYHFQPSATDPRHLADVTVKAHIARFLSITEGYQVADEFAPADPVDPPAPATTTLVGVQEPDGTVKTLAQLDEIELRAIAIEMEIEGARYLPVAELIAKIQAEEIEIDGIDIKAPVEKAEEPGEPENPEAKSEDKPADIAPAVVDQVPANERDALVKQYEDRFGKKPHHKLSAERIKQILAEDEGE